jgi:hypothetical protein
MDPWRGSNFTHRDKRTITYNYLYEFIRTWRWLCYAETCCANNIIYNKEVGDGIIIYLII